MDLPLLIILLALIMVSATLALFTALVISIRHEDNRRHLDDMPACPRELLARWLLGTHAHHDGPTCGRR